MIRFLLSYTVKGLMQQSGWDVEHSLFYPTYHCIMTIVAQAVTLDLQVVRIPIIDVLSRWLRHCRQNIRVQFLWCTLRVGSLSVVAERGCVPCSVTLGEAT